MDHAHQPRSTLKSFADIGKQKESIGKPTTEKVLFVACALLSFSFFLIINLDLPAKPLTDLDTKPKENKRGRGRPFCHLY